MRDLLDRLSSFPQRLTLATEGAAESSRHLPERDGGWSVADVIAHLGDLELVYAVRIRTIVAGAGETPLAALDQNAWVERVHRRETVAELLENFRFQRAHNIALLSRLTEEELDRGGIHPQYGPITVRAAAERLVNHDEKHLAQIERIKAAV
ncbi:MAG TPA: DinB family protein [Thermoanaerobaculia bacterium]